jgi:hypothetical protein
MQVNMRIRNVTTIIVLVRKVGISARDAQGDSKKCCVTRIWRFIRPINVLQGPELAGLAVDLVGFCYFWGRAPEFWCAR